MVLLLSLMLSISFLPYLLIGVRTVSGKMPWLTASITSPLLAIVFFVRAVSGNMTFFSASVANNLLGLPLSSVWCFLSSLCVLHWAVFCIMTILAAVEAFYMWMIVSITVTPSQILGPFEVVFLILLLQSPARSISLSLTLKVIAC